MAALLLFAGVFILKCLLVIRPWSSEARTEPKLLVGRGEDLRHAGRVTVKAFWTKTWIKVALWQEVKG